jgi:hypothetical protein
VLAGLLRGDVGVRLHAHNTTHVSNRTAESGDTQKSLRTELQTLGEVLGCYMTSTLKKCAAGLQDSLLSNTARVKGLCQDHRCLGIHIGMTFAHPARQQQLAQLSGLCQLLVQRAYTPPAASGRYSMR